VSELAGLYSRYKGLALAIGAGLLLEDGNGDGAGLGAETLRLVADAGRTRETDEAHGDPAAAQACHQAALALHRLAISAPGAPGHAALIDDVRVTHRALRSHLWDVIADQYAPCGAHPHRHTQEHDHV
jgi:hypothetical protein